MPHPALRCPDCREHGYVVDASINDAKAMSGAVCHLCGHLLTVSEAQRCLDEYRAEQDRRVLT